MKRFLLCLLLVSLNASAQDAVSPDGGRYWGQLRSGIPHGKGRYEARGGEVYEGEFRNGEMVGQGSYSRPDGTRYSGEFLKWRPHGKGRLVEPGGGVYEGDFKDGLYDGQGTLRMPNGEVFAGRWSKGAYFDAAEAQRTALAVEAALYSQRALLDQALAGLAPSEAGRINLYLLAVAGDGSQEVFRREVEFVRGQFDRDFGTRGRSVALINSRATLASAPMATHTSLREALHAIAAKMDRERDILFVFLTSHGSKEHELKLHQNHILLRGLRPAELAALLKESGARWKVVVVSACYAGGFIEPLKDERTLVIAAARHDRLSFGCADTADLTHFGRAFFKEALASTRSFDEAFGKAAMLVGEWEKRDKIEEGSLPQISSGREIGEHLRRWSTQKP
jgi:peptidase C13-like protein/MORN repeat protein